MGWFCVQCWIKTRLYSVISSYGYFVTFPAVIYLPLQKQLYLCLQSKNRKANACEWTHLCGAMGGWQRGHGTEFTWSPQLRNLAEWDWVPFSFKTNMAENADMEGRWVFARFWVLPRPNIKKRFSRTFLKEFLDIRRRDVWIVHGWLNLSWFGISASSVIYKLREFSSDQPAPSLMFFYLQRY